MKWMNCEQDVLAGIDNRVLCSRFWPKHIPKCCNVTAKKTWFAYAAQRQRQKHDCTQCWNEQRDAFVQQKPSQVSHSEHFCTHFEITFVERL